MTGRLPGDLRFTNVYFIFFLTIIIMGVVSKLLRDSYTDKYVYIYSLFIYLFLPKSTPFMSQFFVFSDKLGEKKTSAIILRRRRYLSCYAT